MAAAIVALATAILAAVFFSAAATAAPAPEVFSGYEDNAFLKGTTPYFVTLDVPAGSYAIMSKLAAGSGVPASTGNLVVDCMLSAGADFDHSVSRLAPGENQTLALQIVHTFSGAGVIQLECQDTVDVAGNSVLLRYVKVTAIRVNPPIVNGPLS